MVRSVVLLRTDGGVAFRDVAVDGVLFGGVAVAIGAVAVVALAVSVVDVGSVVGGSGWLLAYVDVDAANRLRFMWSPVGAYANKLP